MSIEIALTGMKRNLARVSVYDSEGNLRRKFWFYGDGTVAYREWDAKGIDMEFGERTLLGAIEE